MSEAESEDARTVTAAAPSHLADLADGWKTWRTFCLRGAGFPIDLLEGLCAPQAAAAVDRLLERESAAEQFRERVFQRLNDLSDSAEREPLKALRRLRRHLLKGKLPERPPEDPELSALLEQLAKAEESRAAAELAAESAFADGLGRVSEALRGIARDDRFREAVTWQNRKVLKDGIDALLRRPLEERNSQVRRYEQVLASYLQRYCAKNETIGFFGPVGWGAWSEAGPTFAQHPGKRLVTARKTDFEYWAVAALAETFTTIPELRPWLAPRFDASLRIEGDLLIDAEGSGRVLQPLALQVFAACDGKTAARGIAARLLADPACEAKEESEVFTVLRLAAERGLVDWSLKVPVGPAPEARLAEILATVGDEGLRSRLSGQLRELVAARDAVADAAGNAAALDAALAKMEETFSRLTGREAYQRHGRVYAGRTLVYEDCRRNIEFEAGPDLRAEIAPPLALILQSARWFSHTIAIRFEQKLKEIYGELAPRYAPQPVPATAVEFLFGREMSVVSEIVREVVAELTAKWEAILLPGSPGHHVSLASSDLRGEVMRAFSAPRPGWPGARHHSADLMFAVQSNQQGGDCRYVSVLGEIHVTDTMLMRKFFRELHPRPEEFVASYRQDVAPPQIYRITKENFQGHRKVWDPFLSDDYQLSRGALPPWRGTGGVLRLSDLVIEDKAEGLVVRSRDSTRRFPAMTYFERLLWRESFSEFSLLPPRPHTPLIKIDNLVVRRESWRFLCRDLDFASEKSERGRFFAARRWVRQFGLPRRVFVRPPQELKPVYVDFESTISVEILAKLVRRAVEVFGDNAVLGVSEMLPAPRHAWLVDAEGKTYTSELRIVAVDPENWQPPAGQG